MTDIDDIENVLDLVELENFKPDEPKVTKVGMVAIAILNRVASSPDPSKTLEEFGFNNQFQILRQYTTPDVLSVKDKFSGNVYVIIRNTDFKNKTGNRIRDFVQDYFIARGQKENVTRKFEIEKLVKRLIKRFGADKITISGHSLGGYIGTEIATELDLKGVMFNIASSIADRNTRKSDKITNYTTNNPLRGVIDPLSVTSSLRDDYKTKIVPRKEGKGVHDLDNFILYKKD
jgi:hypothetical protein